MSVDLMKVVALARAAGDAVMKVYETDFEVTNKADDSPLTQADLASHHCIVAGLKALDPAIPVLSEESAATDYAQRMSWNTYWLIDPLDGTKEFLKKNGEFTVNIALIRNGEPVAGVVHAPALNVTYWGDAAGAFKQIGDNAPSRIRVSSLPASNQGWRVVGSRSHQTPEFSTFMAALPAADIVPMGSSLKLCLVAEGAADLYPRLGPTSEWDTAAAQAVVTAAGGKVLELATLTPLRCNTRSDSLLNPDFVVCADVSPFWAKREAGQPVAVTYEFKAHDSKADVVWHHTSVTPALRAELNRQQPKCIWLTGYSGSGKSTIANALELELHGRGFHTFLLDGDNVRHGLCKDLGMTDAARTENIRRVGEVAKLMVEAGLVVITAFISPFRKDRDAVRALFAEGDFVETFVNTPLEVCMARDPKGLYKKALKGEIKDFTGVDSAYEPPLQADIDINTDGQTVAETVEAIIKQLGMNR
jgi:3'(2'),5'-bisphosphate nucleotidase